MQRVFAAPKVHKNARDGDWRGAVAEQMCEPFASALMGIDGESAAKATELRFRSGRRMTLRVGNREQEISNVVITPAMLAELVSFLCNFSVYSKQEQLSRGFLALRGGFRAGIAGQAVMDCGAVCAITDVSGIGIRIMRPVIGCADSVVRRLFSQGITSTLIISPPGMGKTTLLRDMIRMLSDKGTRIAVADERSEIAAQFGGEYMMDVGRCTDVMGGCEKHIAISMLLRAMAPDVIAADEIGRSQDADALREAALSGVKIFATAHGTSVDDIKKKAYMGPVLETFESFVVLGGSPGRIVSVSGKGAGGGD